MISNVNKYLNTLFKYNVKCLSFDFFSNKEKLLLKQFLKVYFKKLRYIFEEI